MSGSIAMPSFTPALDPIIALNSLAKVKPPITTRFSCCAKMAIERNMGRNFVV